MSTHDTLLADLVALERQEEYAPTTHQALYEAAMDLEERIIIAIRAELGHGQYDVAHPLCVLHHRVLHGVHDRHFRQAHARVRP